MGNQASVLLIASENPVIMEIRTIYGSHRAIHGLTGVLNTDTILELKIYRYPTDMCQIGYLVTWPTPVAMTAAMMTFTLYPIKYLPYRVYYYDWESGNYRTLTLDWGSL